MAIRTISEYTNTDINFYHVERAGYTTVSSMIYDAFTDMINNGFIPKAIFVNNDKITPARRLASAWPPTILHFTIADPGVGYKKDANVTVPSGTATVPFVGRINGVDTSPAGGRKVTDIDYAEPPIYSVLPDQPSSAVFWDINLGAIDPGYFSGNFKTTQNVVVNAGQFPTGLRSTALTKTTGLAYSGTTPAGWWAQFGFEGNGINPLTGLSTASSTWPTNSNALWSFGRDIVDVYKGQEVFADDPAAIIPPGTYIVDTVSGKIVANYEYTASYTIGSGPSAITYPAFWKETTLDYTAYKLSNAVTIPSDTIVKTRGRGLKFFSNIIQATTYTATLEAGGGVDPLNDVNGVFGNVAATTTNNNIVIVTNISNGQGWKPVIYPGQEVTSLLTVGSLSANTVVTVVSANMSTNYTTAVVKLSANVSFGIANEPLRFKFAQLQPWRITANVVNSQLVNLYAATPIQLDDNGNIANVTNSGGTIIDRAGAMGAAPTLSGGSPNPNNVWEGFINRQKRVTNAAEAFPLNYALTITNRGAFLGVWEGSWSTLQEDLNSNDSYFNWFLIQRPVNKLTGATLTTGCAPVFCVNSVGYKYFKFIVREADVLHPYQGKDINAYKLYVDETGATPMISNTAISSGGGAALGGTNGPYAFRTPADAHWKDSYALLNTDNQISLTEDSKYLVSFLHNLTTPRFRYSEELDMLGQTSADVCMASNEVSITAYQESGPRLYKALPANNIYNSGLRICVLKKMP